MQENLDKKGDRVILYMPMVPEAAYAMLACARVGAIHSVVFAGFSPESLASRIIDCGAKAVITANEAPRGGKQTPLKKNVDEALDIAGDIISLVLRRTSARSLRAMCIGMSTRDVKFQVSYLLRKLSTSKKVPLLLIWGDKDNFIPLFVGKKIANFHRWVKLKIVSNSGHCIHDEDPSLFNRISYEWIRDLKTF